MTTPDGKEYKPITDFKDLESSKLIYSNLTELNKLSEKVTDSASLLKAIENYETRCSQIIYYLSRVENDSFIIIPIDKEPYTKALEHINKNPNQLSKQPKQYVAQSKKYFLSDENESEDIYIKNLKQLVADIIEEKYSSEELKEVKYRLSEHQGELESVLTTVDLYQENFGESKEITDRISEHKPKIPKSEINIDDIFENVTKTLIAQDEPARRAIVEISRLADSRKKGYGILLTGESGVGKTLLMSLIARNTSKPLLIIDSTQLTAPGFVGKSIEEYLWDLYESCGKDLKKAENAIIYFDEIDKKGSPNKTDMSGQAVLNTLLKFLDGTSYVACKNQQRQTNENSIKISTENMIVVAGGAFLDVYKQKDKTKLGFTSPEEKANEHTVEPEISDFVTKAMMTKEFMGRVPVIVHLNNLDVDGLRRILLNSEESILKLQEEVFRNKGVKLTTKDGYILSISQNALARKIGARGLNKLIADSTWVAYDEICSNPGIYEEVILTEETVENPKKYQLVKKTNNQSNNTK